MFGKQSNRQTGFALLIFLVIMMGLGGIALTGFSQKVIKAVEKNRFEHNKDDVSYTHMKLPTKRIL